MVGEAGSARAAFQLIESVRPDVVLMDIVLPGMDGVVATREILRRRPEVKVLIVSGHDKVQDVHDALAAGAVGYVLKAESADTLLDALEQVGRGERYIAPSLAAQLSMVSCDRARPPDVLGVLSEREHEVFRLAADCQEPNDIARELCLARKTVDTHLNRINRKLGLRNRAALVRLAARLGLVHAVRTSRAASDDPAALVRHAGDDDVGEHDGLAGDSAAGIVRVDAQVQGLAGGDVHAEAGVAAGDDGVLDPLQGHAQHGRRAEVG